MNNRYRLLKGEELQPGSQREAMVGKLVYARLGVDKADLDIGKVIVFSGEQWTVKGIFEAGGTNAEGEIWVPIGELQTVLGRKDYSYSIIKLKNESDVDSVVKMIASIKSKIKRF